MRYLSLVFAALTAGSIVACAADDGGGNTEQVLAELQAPTTADSPPKSVGIFYNTSNQHNWQCVTNCAEHQWRESVYSHGNHSWGKPAFGFYDGRDVRLIDQHAEWLAAAGVDYVVFDFTNNMGSALMCDRVGGGTCWNAGWEWCKYQWEKGNPPFPWGEGNHCNVGEIEDGGRAFVERMAWRKQQGLPYVKVTAAVGTEGWCDEVITGGMMTRQFNLIKARYIDNPTYKGVWHHVNGKPFLLHWLGGCAEYQHSGHPHVSIADHLGGPPRNSRPWHPGWGRDRAPDFANSDFEWRFLDTALSGRNLVQNKAGGDFRSVHGMWSLMELEEPQLSYSFRDNRPEQMVVSPARRLHHGQWSCKGDGSLFRKDFELARQRGVHTLLVTTWNFWAKGEERDSDCSFTIEPEDGGYGFRMLEVMKEEITRFKGHAGNGTGGTPPPPNDGPGAPPGPSGTTLCALEGETCRVEGSRSVAYGANGVFVWRTVSRRTKCGNGVFGDPLPGVRKACFVGAAVSPISGRVVLNPAHAPAQALSVVSSGRADGDGMHLYGYFGGTAQQWDVLQRADGLVSFKNVNSGKCLDNRYDALNGGRVGQWTCDAANPAQLWRVSALGGGKLRIDSKQSGLAVEVSNGTTQNGARVQQWTYLGTAHQQWTARQL